MIKKYDGQENQIRFCWHGGAFYEFVLPDGRVLITDPYQYTSKRRYVTAPGTYAADVISGCDYVLLTHTHFDHAEDLPSIVAKFPNAVIIVPDDAYLSLMLIQGYNALLSCIQPVGNLDKLVFEGFSLEAFRGKHTLISVQDPVLKNMPDVFTHGIPVEEQRRYRAEDGSLKIVQAMYDIEAGMAFRNYKLCFDNGETIFIWGGEIEKDYRRNIYTEMKPSLFLVQLAATNMGGDRENPSVDAVVDFIEKVEPENVIPIHQENFAWEQLGKIEGAINSRLVADGGKAKYLNPTPATWYTVEKG